MFYATQYLSTKNLQKCNSFNYLIDISKYQYFQIVKELFYLLCVFAIFPVAYQHQYILSQSKKS